ncbi:hypothetical protein Trco_003913 [Trichoderma cornu-damae]|uniref:Uncharacterized protein n=1 Tax=Trichoderma cornu-damae TaxID=654480 RepID=A0A9P8QLH4_9HYPO|nr:hypothetical protein Trco_003913 [Trichoderma cornu-damae]
MSVENSHCDDGIEADQKEAFQPMALSVANEIVDQQHGDEHDGNLEGVEAQVHLVVAHAPADDDQQGDEKQGDLHAGSDGDANGKVHLVLDGDGDGGGVLGGVADNGEQDEADKLLGQGAVLGDGVDGSDHVLGAEGNDGGGGGKGADGDEEVQLGILLLLVVVLLRVDEDAGHLLVAVLLDDAAADEGAGDHQALLEVRVRGPAAPGLGGHLLALLVEDLLVRLELEEQVGAVDDEQDDGGAAGELGHVIGGRVGGGVEDGGDDDGGGRQGQHGGGGLGHDGVEVLLRAAQAAEEEAEAHDQQQVGEDGADERGLDNGNLVVDEGDDGDDELDGIAERGVEQAAEGLAGPEGDLLGGEAQHGGKGDDGDEVDDEDGDAADGVDVVDGDADRGGNQQQVDPRVEQRPLDLVGHGEGLLGVDVADEAALLVRLLGLAGVGLVDGGLAEPPVLVPLAAIPQAIGVGLSLLDERPLVAVLARLLEGGFLGAGAGSGGGGVPQGGGGIGRGGGMGQVLAGGILLLALLLEARAVPGVGAPVTPGYVPEGVPRLVALAADGVRLALDVEVID